MKITSIFLIVIVAIVNFGCKSHKENKKISQESIQSTLGDIDESATKQNLIKGDTTSYKLLRLLYYKTDRAIEFLPWALLMSNKFNYKPAYYDVSFTLENFNLHFGHDSSGSQTQVLDSLTYKFAKTYLSTYEQ